MDQKEKEQIQNLLKKMKQEIKESHFSRNLPICYMNAEGWLVEEYKDGKIVKLKKLNGT